MPFRDAVRGLRVRSQHSNSSSASYASSSSSPTSTNIPMVDRLSNGCPNYEWVCSNPVQDQPRSLDGTSSRTHLEEALDAEPEEAEKLPPYEPLDNNAQTPDHSKDEEASYKTKISRLERTLSFRCNIRRAKAWYLQVQKERAER